MLFKELKRGLIEKFIVYLSSVRNMLPGGIVTPVKKLKLMVFVLCAFTGLGHADIMKLTHADIHTDDNGNRAAQ